MLEFLRRAVRSWVAKALLGLLVASFAVWGVGDVASGLSTEVAQVGDRGISVDEYGRVLQNQQRRYQIESGRIAATGLDRFALATMVREAAVEEAAARLGLSAPDFAVAEQVRNDPSFQLSGQFDPEQYRASVRRAFGSVPEFENTLRRALAAGVIRQAAASASPPPGAAEALARREAEARRFEAITLTAEAHAEAPPEPDDADLEAFLEENAADFAEPERRDVTFLRLPLAALAEQVAIDEAEVRALYDERRADYVTAESRAIDQIVYDDRAAAEAAAERVASGAASFDDLLAERGLTREDAALGAVTREDLSGPRADAAFGLAEPGLAGPAEVATGWALLDVVAITPGDETPFEAVRDDLRLELAEAEALPELDRLAEEVADLRAAGATIEETASELGLPLGSVEGLSRDGLLPDGTPAEGLPSAPAFREEAFAAAEGAERALEDAPDGGYFTLRVDALTQSATPPLAEIREEVAEAWRAARRRESLREAAEAARDRVAAGEPIAAVAADLGVEVSTLGPLRRNDPDPRLGADARETLFAAPEPGAAAVSVRGTRATVAALAEIETPEAVAETADAFARALAQSVQQDQLEYLGRALEREAGVSLNESAVSSVVSQLGG